MNILPRDRETVCAVSTPHGRGGISVIRVSGSESLKATRKLCRFLPEKPESHKIYFGHLNKTNSSEIIDEVLVSYFADGKSYTGEEVVEISCHGSPSICEEILRNLILNGARPADRGEFTYRAFLNQKLDLAQAEGVLDLIESQSQAQRKMALRQLRGHYSGRLRDFENEITRILAHIEADIDFSTENLETISRKDAVKAIEEIEKDIIAFAQSYEKGRKIHDGIHVTFLGCPNVGKSTLFNTLLQEERAIVTDVAGTTRDVLEGEILYGENKFVISDTAGIREKTTDVIEKMGIERSKNRGREADVLLLVFDLSADLTQDEREFVAQLNPENCLVLLNKADLLSGRTLDEVQSEWILKACRTGIFFKNQKSFNDLSKENFLVVSSRQEHLRDVILHRILERFSLSSVVLDDLVVTQARHYDALGSAAHFLKKAASVLKNQESLEFVAFELRESLLKIQEILGIHYDDQILDKVFKEFCLGK